MQISENLKNIFCTNLLAKIGSSLRKFAPACFYLFFLRTIYFFCVHQKIFKILFIFFYYFLSEKMCFYFISKFPYWMHLFKFIVHFFVVKFLWSLEEDFFSTKNIAHPEDPRTGAI